jgi:hypothetical protein
MTKTGPRPASVVTLHDWCRKLVDQAAEEQDQDYAPSVVEEAAYLLGEWVLAAWRHDVPWADFPVTWEEAAASALEMIQRATIS